MKNLSRKTKIVLVFAGLSLALSLMVLAGSWYWIDHMQTKLHETKVNTKRVQDEQQQLAALEKLALETKEERARLASYILTNEDEGAIAFLSELERIARQRGVTPMTNAIATQAISNVNGFDELVVNLGLSGTLVEVKEVIKRYEHMPYQVRIERLALRAGGKDGATAELAIAVTKMKKP